MGERAAGMFLMNFWRQKYMNGDKKEVKYIITRLCIHPFWGGGLNGGM